MKHSLTTSEVARMLGAAVGSVSKWIDDGQLAAGRTPGGHRRVARENLIAFLYRQKLPVPPELLPSNPKVLIVDDEPSITRWLTAEIASARPELEVLIAHDGFTAGEIVASSRPQVVVLDLRMPGIDGYEVCRRIKARPDTVNTVVLMMTAYPLAENEKRATDAGAQALFAKPLNLTALLQEILAATCGFGVPASNFGQ
jgi:two-component system, OmpR family, response regulator RpaA